MRRLMLLMTVAALVAALAAGTATAKQDGKDRATYNFKGAVQEIAVDGSYVVVDATDGNRRAREQLGIQPFGVTEDTKVEVNEEEAMTFDLVAGGEVKVQSKVARDATEFVARKISVEAKED